MAAHRRRKRNTTAKAKPNWPVLAADVFDTDSVEGWGRWGRRPCDGAFAELFLTRKAASETVCFSNPCRGYHAVFDLQSLSDALTVKNRRHYSGRRRSTRKRRRE
jgi:hypothetical protein